MSLLDGRWEVREGPALRRGGGYYFRGPVREDGLCFEGALALGTCAACANEYSHAGPFCVGCAQRLRGVRLSKSKVPTAGFGLFTSTSCNQLRQGRAHLRVFGGAHRRLDRPALRWQGLAVCASIWSFINLRRRARSVEFGIDCE